MLINLYTVKDVVILYVSKYRLSMIVNSKNLSVLTIVNWATRALLRLKGDNNPSKE